MRKIDKQINIIKSNLLCEQRYLTNKGVINELDTRTYSKLMSRTDGFPTMRFMDPEVGQRKNLGTQYMRINTAAQERFVKSFYQKFNNDGTISIETSSGTFVFVEMGLLANHGSYELFFKGDGKVITINDDASGENGIHVNKGVKINSESIELVKEMLKYNKK
jgi:hypothetical protein